jgi:hypothetical protein
VKVIRAMALLAIPFLMLVLGVPIAVLVLIGLAIKNRNVALAVFIAGGAAMMLCLVVAIIVALSYQTTSFVSSSTAIATPAPGDMQLNTVVQSLPQLPQPGVNYVVHNSSGFKGGFNISWAVMFIFLLVILVALIARRLTSRGACGPHRMWSTCLLIPLLIFLFLGFVLPMIARYRSFPQEKIRSPSAAVQTPSSPFFSAHKWVNHQQVVKTSTNEDINKEIEAFDAPRIPLSPGAGATNVAPAVASSLALQQVNVTGDPTQPSSDASESDATAKKEASNTKSSHGANKTKKSDTKSDKPKSKPATVAHSSEQIAATTQTGKPSPKAESFTGERPAWVDRPPHRTGNTNREVIATDEYQSEEECYQAGDIYLMLRTYQHMQQLAGIPSAHGPLPSISFTPGLVLGDGIAIATTGFQNPNWIDSRLRALNDMGIGTEYIYREIVAKDSSDNEPREFLDTVQRSIGQMKKLYLEVEFTPDVDRELRQIWFAHARHERFAIVGVIGGNVLIVLGFIFALLKLDTWTKGYYTKRLFIGVPAVIIAGVLIVGLFVGHRF